LPIVGWLGLRREAAIHGRGFWIRPLLLELLLAAALPALYWWEVDQLGLVQGQVGVGIAPEFWPVALQFASHALLLCLMLAATFIDFDEKIIPDEITLPGTILGLLLATLAPAALLPSVAERAAPPVVGDAVIDADHEPVIGRRGDNLWLEPVTPIAPQAWPAEWVDVRNGRTLLVAFACIWMWCFAIAPRVWRGRRGVLFAIKLIARRIWREMFRLPLAGLWIFGTGGVGIAWLAAGADGRTGMITALVGLAVSGGIVWAVRLIGTAALKREAMGFGDVTLMMMIGTFLGWQACLIIFFLAPFAGLAIGLLQFVFRRGDVIPYGPFLCLATAVVVVAWAPIWQWAQPLFEQGWLVPAVLAVCLVLLGVILTFWQLTKRLLFGRGPDGAGATSI
jgi:prepilin signal peptidase PulO-like enzyme (type II secretory pathway)